MKIHRLAGRGYASNCYLLESDGHAIVIDPSLSIADAQRAIGSELPKVDLILLTHAHFDHILSLDTLRDATQAPCYVHKDDADSLMDGKKNAFYTFFGQDKKYRPAEILLSGGEKIKLGNIDLEIISTPGHTKGCICIKAGNTLFTGDTLFADSYGRCDLYSGDYKTLMSTLNKMRELDGRLKIYPGHGCEAILSRALDVVRYL